MRCYHSWSDWPAARVALDGRLAPDLVGRLGAAYRFAVDQHGDQVRPAGEPYPEHLLETLEILVDSGVPDAEGDVVSLFAALLHDAVEDTPCTSDDILRHFGVEVAVAVDWLTRPRAADESQADAAASREKYLSRFADAPVPMLAVKLSDRYSNVQRLHTHPRPDARRRYYAETVDWFLPLADRIPFYATLFTEWAEEYRHLAG